MITTEDRIAAERKASCEACAGNVDAGKSCYACGRKGPSGQGARHPAPIDGDGGAVPVEVRGSVLSNFAPAPFELWGRRWATSEHAYQAGKATNAADAASIQAVPRARDAQRLGRKITCRTDWDAVRDAVMLEALRAKFAQCRRAREYLLATGERPIVETAPEDRYWGTGHDGRGKNRLGKLLEQVRVEIRCTERGTPQ